MWPPTHIRGKRSLQKLKEHSAYTLVELLVVITIIAVLAGLLFPVISTILEHSRKVQALNDTRQIVNASAAYFSEYQKYPIDSSLHPGDTVFSTDNNQLIDVLRNMTGPAVGNALNRRGVFYLNPPSASNQGTPRSGLQTSTGVWYDPWGSPYNIAIDGNYDGMLNSPDPLPDFYTDSGPLHYGVMVWAFGKNGRLGGGPAIVATFGNEGGSPGLYARSGDVRTW